MAVANIYSVHIEKFVYMEELHIKISLLHKSMESNIRRGSEIGVSVPKIGLRIKELMVSKREERKNYRKFMKLINLIYPV